MGEQLGEGKRVQRVCGRRGRGVPLGRPKAPIKFIVGEEHDPAAGKSFNCDPVPAVGVNSTNFQHLYLPGPKP